MNQRADGSHYRLSDGLGFSAKIILIFMLSRPLSINNEECLNSALLSALNCRSFLEALS